MQKAEWPSPHWWANHLRSLHHQKMYAQNDKKYIITVPCVSVLKTSAGATSIAAVARAMWRATLSRSLNARGHGVLPIQGTGMICKLNAGHVVRDKQLDNLRMCYAITLFSASRYKPQLVRSPRLHRHSYMKGLEEIDIDSD